MDFTCKINMDNAAFDEDMPERELRRILVNMTHEVFHRVIDGGIGEPIRDINGNKVGHWEITTD